MSTNPSAREHDHPIFILEWPDIGLSKQKRGNLFPHLDLWRTPHQLGILAKAFPPGPSRSIAFATFSAGAPIGAIFSTVLGGVLTQVTKCVTICLFKFQGAHRPSQRHLADSYIFVLGDRPCFYDFGILRD